MKKEDREIIQDGEGKENLLKEIRRNAEKEAEEIISQAKQTAEQKLSSLRARADRVRRDAEERAADKVGQMERNTLSSINVQKKRIRLGRNEEIIREIFEKVRERLNRWIDSEEYPQILKRWAVEALVGLDVDQAEITVSRQEMKYLTDGFVEELRREAAGVRGREISLRIAERPTERQGVLARSSDGRLEYRNQIDTIIRRNQMELRKLVYNTLDIEGA